MARKQHNYFEAMEQLVAYSAKAATLLVNTLESYKAEDIGIYRKDMHLIENQADKLRHETVSALSHEFITPIDQEDILRIVQIIDDVTDAIDEAVIDLYMYNISSIPVSVNKLANWVVACVDSLQKTVNELKNYKRPEKLNEHLVEIDENENQADKVYIGAIRELFGKDTDYRNVIGLKAVYDSLEGCCDLCQNAADIIEQTVLKNS